MKSQRYDDHVEERPIIPRGQYLNEIAPFVKQMLIEEEARRRDRRSRQAKHNERERLRYWRRKQKKERS